MSSPTVLLQTPRGRRRNLPLLVRLEPITVILLKIERDSEKALQ